jgi:hypothetical protein
MTTALAVPEVFLRDTRRWLRLAVGVGAALFIVSIIGAFFSPGDFYRSYLMGYLLWISITLGSLAVVMLQYVTGGAWGIVSRRALEAATRTLPLLVLLFIPLCFGLHHLYDWANPDLVRHEYALQHRSGYLNVPFFIVRAAIYFAIWGVFTYFLNRWSAEQDLSGGMGERVAIQKRLIALSSPGLVVYVFTLSFAAVDWAESLETDWHSSIWGFLFVAQQGVSAFAFAIIVLAWLSRREPLLGRIKPSHFHNLGNLLLAFVMLWAYFSYSQLNIVWSGNLTDEISFYLHRLRTSWGWVGIALLVLQFLVPFTLLLFRPVKRNGSLLCGIAILMILMRFVDTGWLVLPSTFVKGFRLHWLNFSVPAAIGALWIAAFLWHISKRPLLPLAPKLEEALQHG